MHSFSVHQLHLAAYIKANGAIFRGCVDRSFLFDSSKPLDHWRVEHANSCCRRVDIELVSLREYLKPIGYAQKS